MLSSCLEAEVLDPSTQISRAQNTLAREVVMDGIGLFSGMKIRMKFIPAPENTGIIFRRTDLSDIPSFSATYDHLAGTPRCTNLGNSKVLIQSVEHVLSALYANDIDNLFIELDGPEVPAVDGSSLVFIELIEKAGLVSQNSRLFIHQLQEPVYWSKEDVHLVALPSNEFRISYTLNYPGHPLLDAQYFSCVIDPITYKTQVAPSRTFSLYEEIIAFLDKGLIKGGSLDSGVVIKGQQVMNAEGLRFPNEMVRHKILDLLGDLALSQLRFRAHIIAVKSGHCSNTEFGKKLRHRVKGSGKK